MTGTTRNHGCTLVRIAATVGGFRAKHGAWPNTVELDPASFPGLITHYLTPSGLYLLQSKVHLEEGEEGTIVARGVNGTAFNYSEAAEGIEIDMEQAYLWLGLDLPQ